MYESIFGIDLNAFTIKIMHEMKKNIAENWIILAMDLAEPSTSSNFK